MADKPVHKRDPEKQLAKSLSPEEFRDRLAQQLKETPPKALEELPDEKRDEAIQQLLDQMFMEGDEITFEMFSSFRGPMPPPEMLAHYNQIHPGFADAMLTDFVEQGKHRRSLEEKAVTDQLKESRRGQVFAFILSLIIIGVGSALIFYNEKLALGLSVIFGNLVTLIGLHLGGKKSQRKDLEDKE